jgi:hypothetical protein
LGRHQTADVVVVAAAAVAAVAEPKALDAANSPAHPAGHNGTRDSKTVGTSFAVLFVQRVDEEGKEGLRNMNAPQKGSSSSHSAVVTYP